MPKDQTIALAAIESEDGTPISGIIIEPAMRLAEYRRRNNAYNIKSVHVADISSASEKGWTTFGKVGARSARVRQAKPHFQRLEDRIWCLLYRLGYANQSERNFRLSFKRNSGAGGSKQLDVVAFDAETAIVVECKSKESRGKRSLQKDIEETRALQEYIRQSICSALAANAKPKFIWMYATNNIIWSDPDIERARDAGIYIVTENELSYFETFVSHMGAAGKYQLLGELLKGTKIPGLGGTRVPALRGSMGGYRYYSFVCSANDLMRVAFINHQAFNHPDGQPAYQRMISATRLKQIAEYIRGGGFFPNNILANFIDSPKFEPLPQGELDADVKIGMLTLPSKFRSVWIIDGQHRLLGFAGLDEKFANQGLSVLAFEKMDGRKEADLFITINHKQKSVPPGLLLTLLADLRMGDPDPNTALNAVASAVVRAINRDRTSPLFGRFARPDVPAEPNENLTLSEAVKGLKQSNLLGKVLHDKVSASYLTGATDAETIERSRRILNGYFEAIRSANVERWDAGRTAYVCVNPGVRAHLRLIPELLSYLSHRRSLDFQSLAPDAVVSELCAVIEPILKFVAHGSDEQVAKAFSRRFGEAGVRDYWYYLVELVNSQFADFGSEEFHQRRERRADEQAEETTHTILKLTEILHDHVIATLKAIHGEQMLESGELAYWDKGVQNKDVRKRAYEKQQEDPEDRRKRKEAYLDTIQLKSIIEQDNNWLHFQSVFNLPMESEKKGKKFYTGWLGRLNDLRKIAAHKNELREYKDEDMEFVSWLHSELGARLKIHV